MSGGYGPQEAKLPEPVISALLAKKVSAWPRALDGFTVEARKLDYDCPPTPKPRQEGQPA